MKAHVVVGYDQTSSSESALDVAASEAAWRGADLTVVHAFHHAPVAWPPYKKQAVEGAVRMAALRLAHEGANRARSHHPRLLVYARAEAGAAPSILADLSSRADLLVVGHRGRGGFAGMQLGSVALRTVTRAACPILVVRGAEHEARGLVLAAVDVGDPAEEILGFAFADAAHRGARLKAISAMEILWPWAAAGDTGQLKHASTQVRERANVAMQRLMPSWQAKYPEVPAECEVVEGSPTAILTAATTYADLIVAGAHRRGEAHHDMRLGPIAHTLLLHSDCPVAIIPHR